MKNIYKKMHKAIVWYALIGAIPMIAAFTGYYLKHGGQPPETGLWNFVNDLAFLWILSLFYLVLALLFYPDFRDSLLTRLSGFKEDDEREELITAKATRTTFLLMLALEIVLFIMSMTTIQVTRDPTATDGRNHVLSIGFRADSDQIFNIFSLQPSSPAIPQGQIGIINGYLMPPNISIILLLLILIQVGSFKILFRRHNEHV